MPKHAPIEYRAVYIYVEPTTPTAIAFAEKARKDVIQFLAGLARPKAGPAPGARRPRCREPSEEHDGSQS